MLSLTIYQKNANQNYSEVTTSQVIKAVIKNLQTVNGEEGVEKREPSQIVGGNVNWFSHYREQYEGSLKN